MIQSKKSKKNIKGEKAFDEEGCQEMIKNAIDSMEDFSHRFSYSSLHPFIGWKSQMRTNSIYLRFNCKNCIQNERRKRFTTILGTSSIWFQFQKQDPKKEKYPLKLVFEFQIYRMRCLTCGMYGVGEIYDSQLQKIEKRFCRLVANILNKVPRDKTRNKEPIEVPDLHNHQHMECEACHLGICHTGDCPAQDGSSKTSQEQSSQEQYSQEISSDLD